MSQTVTVIMNKDGFIFSNSDTQTHILYIDLFSHADMQVDREAKILTTSLSRLVSHTHRCFVSQRSTQTRKETGINGKRYFKN